jgi:putative transposase
MALGTGTRLGSIWEFAQDFDPAGCTRRPTSSTPLPKSVQPVAPKAIAEIRDAEDREHALAAIKNFERNFGAKWPTAVAKIVDDTEVLLSFFDYPAEHWIHLKTTDTNPIESTFATVRLRTKVTKGPGSRAAGLPMAYKLIEAAEDRWWSVKPPTSSPLSWPSPNSTRG